MKLVNGANYDIHNSEVNMLIEFTVRRNPDLTHKQILNLAGKMYDRYISLQIRNQNQMVANLLPPKRLMCNNNKKNKYTPQKIVVGFTK